MHKKNQTEFDVIVLGAGVLGASVFHHLVTSGYRVGLIDKNTQAGACTAWSGGIVRCFHTHSSLSDKASFSFSYYKHFERHTGESAAFNQTGFVYFPALNSLQFAEQEVTRLATSLPIQWLSPSQLKEKFSHLLTQTTHPAVYEPLSGYMSPIEVTKAWIRSGEKKGGRLYEGQGELALSLIDDQTIHISTKKHQFTTRHMVIATGAETPSLLDSLNISHDLYAQLIQVDVRKPAQWPSDHPAFIDDEFDLNGRPHAPDKHIFIGHPTGLKVSMQSAFNPSTAHSERICQEGGRRWRWVEKSSYASSLTHPDCYSPDGLGRVGRAHGHKNVWLATGFSGGGFKMAPWVGHEINQLIKESEHE